MVGASKRLVVHDTTNLHAATSQSSEPGPYRHASCEQEAHSSSCRLGVPLASLLESFSRIQRGRVINRLPPTGIGTGVVSQ